MLVVQHTHTTLPPHNNHSMFNACRADDLQISFNMLDPHIRQPMQHDGNGRYSLRFTVPDVYGVFKYVIDYSHRGYSHISLQQVRACYNRYFVVIAAFVRQCAVFVSSYSHIFFQQVCACL